MAIERTYGQHNCSTEKLTYRYGQLDFRTYTEKATKSVKDCLTCKKICKDIVACKSILSTGKEI